MSATQTKALSREETLLEALDRVNLAVVEIRKMVEAKNLADGRAKGGQPVRHLGRARGHGGLLPDGHV
jgi:hypothetical protein